MTRHAFEVMAAMPYFTKKTVTEADKDIQRLLYAVKDGKNVTVRGKVMTAAEWFVGAFSANAQDRPFLNAARTIVPIPSSQVTPQPPLAAQWVCLDIAQRLAATGLVRDCRAIVRRTTAVRSSREARSAGESAPTVDEHRASFEVDASLLRGVDDITLFDDVVSAGCNSMGAYQALRAAGFQGDVKLFTVAYTTYTPGLRVPFYGEIVWMEGNASSFRP